MNKLSAASSTVEIMKSVTAPFMDFVSSDFVTSYLTFSELSLNNILCHKYLCILFDKNSQSVAHNHDTKREERKE